MNHEDSKIKVQVGPDFDGEGKTFINFELNYSKQKANLQLQYLKNLIGNQQDQDFAIVATIQALPGKAEQLKQAITRVLSSIEEDSYLLETQIKGDKIHLSCKFKPESEYYNMMMQPFNMFFTQGLDTLASDQQSTITAQIKSNENFYDYLDHLKQGERLLSAIFKSIKFESHLKLHKELASKLREVIQNFDPDSASEPSMISFLMFKNFDLDIKFKNTDDLPEIVKKQGLFGKKLQKNTAEENKYTSTIEGLDEIFESIGEGHEIWFTIPDCLALNITLKATGLSKLIEEYGGGFEEMLQ